MMKIRNKMKPLIGVTDTDTDSYLENTEDYHNMKTRINILENVSESDVILDTETIIPMEVTASVEAVSRELEVVDLNVEEDNEIVVSNTLTQDWEMKPYFDLANKYGFRVVSLIIENRHGGTNIHGVPEEKIQAMRDRFEISL